MRSRPAGPLIVGGRARDCPILGAMTDSTPSGTSGENTFRSGLSKKKPAPDDALAGRDLGADLNLARAAVDPMDNNVYLLHEDGRGLLIDAPGDPEAIEKLAEEAGVSVETILITHRHNDHTGALERLVKSTGAKVVASYLDAPAIPVAPDVELRHGDTISFAERELPVALLRGHTPGGLALAAKVDGRVHLFVGDSLFPDGLGKTVSEGDFARLFRDVTARLFDVFDDAVVHPGHGKDTTLSAERPKLDEWWQRRW